MTNTEKMLTEIKEDTAAIRQKLDDHIDNEVIHQVPPCSGHKDLSKKLWAIGFAAVSALFGVVWNTLKS